MKIAVDARLLRGGGIGRFIREVTGPWLARDDVEEVVFLGHPDHLEAWLTDLPVRDGARVVRWMDGAYSARAQVRAWGRVARALEEADVRFFPHYDVPVVSQHPPSVVVVHDLTHFQPGSPFPLHKRVLGNRLLNAVLQRATRIITVSENSRRDLVARVPWKASSMHVVKPGVAEVFTNGGAPRADGEGTWTSFQPFLLTVGQPRPHKNLEFAVDVLAALRRKGRTDLSLLAVGATGGASCPVRQRAEEHGLAKSVLTLARVTESTLADLYRSAEALLFPSLYEGFGLPVVEALACGCPVVASNRASIPEAAGGHGILLDPLDLDQWTNALLEQTDGVRGNGTPPHRWPETSERVFEVLRSAVEGV